MKQAWKKLFKPWILDRGLEYFNEDRVTDLHVDNDEITAYVEGSEDYSVTILLEDQMPVELYCDCPYADGGEYCKHMAAVLFAVDDSHDHFNVQALPNTSEWQAAIDHLSENALRALVLKWAEKNPQLQTELTLLYTGALPSGASQTWEADLQEMIDDVSDRHGFVDYRNAYDLMCSISDYLEENLDLLLSSGLLMDAFELVYTVFDIADKIDMDDSDGGLYMLFSECTDAWQKIVALADDTQQIELYQELRECMNHSEWNFGQQELETLFFSLPWSETLLRKNKDLLDQIISHHAPENDYQFFHYLSYKEEILRNLGASDHEIIDFWKEHSHLFHARNRLLDLYMTCDLDAAISLLCECKKQDQENRRLVTLHSEKLIELYQLKNMQPELKAELQFLTFQCRTIKTTYLHLLKELCDTEEWSASVQNLLSLTLLPHDRFVILDFEQRYQQLLDEIMEQQDFSAFKHYEKALHSWSPDIVCPCFVDFLKHEMQAASNRKQYWSVIQHLNHLFKYPNGNQVVSDLAEYWRVRHYNRPAMKDELQKAGY